MNLGKSAKNADNSAMQPATTDAERAANLLDEVIGSRGVREPVKTMLERAYTDLVKLNDRWTRRRVRAVFNKEANRIDHREIEEMHAVIEARKAHAAYRQETARLASVAVIRAKAHHGDLAAR